MKKRCCRLILLLGDLSDELEEHLQNKSVLNDLKDDFESKTKLSLLTDE